MSTKLSKLHLVFMTLSVLAITGMLLSNRFEYIQIKISLYRDYYELVDIGFNFKILSQVCSENTPMMLHVVVSAANNILRRNVIRKMCKNDSAIVKTVFALGMPQNATLQKEIEQENYLYSDIIQGNFNDAYRNMTYKHVMALKYLNYYCSNANYLLKTDDDIFVNTKILQKFVSTNLKERYPKNLILCKPQMHAPVYRSSSKWNVLKSEYSPDFYPPYCPGWMIIYSSDVVKHLYQKSRERKNEFLWIDDVFVSGILATNLSTPHKRLSSVYIMPRENIKKLNKGEEVVDDRPFIFSPPETSVAEFRALWNFTLTQDVPDTLEKFGV
ncbi:beta-1,3-galactosyltransferase 5-like [Aethina tumida]|uniref:beta-1,3-galactosyltransferase 5-like n=1 Tax=Aethina tumida TaxID=116153 RepID=UPI00214720AE|nr:beta-1,3-galactosyltransferase 5-like [Aethina tumida]